MRDHTKLRAFELADELALIMYQATKERPEKVLGAVIRAMRKT